MGTEREITPEQDAAIKRLLAWQANPPVTPEEKATELIDTYTAFEADAEYGGPDPYAAAIHHQTSMVELDQQRLAGSQAVLAALQEAAARR